MNLDGGRDLGPVGVTRGPAHRRLGGLRRPGPVRVEALEVYDRRGDGHTLSRHCGSTPAVEAARLARHRELPATGSFPDAATAQRSVEACVAANREGVERWRGENTARLVLDHAMGEAIGGVLRRSRWAAGEGVPLPASTVRVVLERNPTYRAGFAVLTAYPVRHDPPSRTLPAPPLPPTVSVMESPGVRGGGDGSLRRRLRRDPGVSAASSFLDRTRAGLAVRGALLAAGADVDDWLLCEQRPRLAIDARIGGFLGVVLTRTAYRRHQGSEPAHSVHVVLHRSPSPPWGFRVAAAYPRLP